jgi:hypothetical protein
MTNTFKIYFLIAGLTILLAFLQKLDKAKQIERGKSLFYKKGCSSCHAETTKKLDFPFQRDREIYGREWVYQMIWNNQLLRIKDIRALELFKKCYNTFMPVWPNMTKADIDAICDYVDSFPYDPNSKDNLERKVK